ncbi:MAG: septum formation initiator family protein [Gaiellales bacterium]
MGRLVAVAVLLLMAALYVGPVEKYLKVQQELRQQRALVHRLDRVHGALDLRVAQLQGKAAIVECARARGWVFPGEQSLIVTGVPTTDQQLSC